MTEHKELFAALVAASEEFEALIKTRSAKIDSQRGGGFSYSYANLADVLDATRGALAKHGLRVVQTPGLYHVEGKAVVTVSGAIIHVSGDEYSLAEVGVPVGGNGDARAVGSAISYARRYQLLAVLGLAAEDDDGAEASRPAPKLFPQQPAPGAYMPHPVLEQEDIDAQFEALAYPTWREKIARIERGADKVASDASYKFLAGLIDEATGQKASYAKVLSALVGRPVHSGAFVTQATASALIESLSKQKTNRETKQKEPNPAYDETVVGYVAKVWAEAQE